MTWAIFTLVEICFWRDFFIVSLPSSNNSQVPSAVFCCSSYQLLHFLLQIYRNLVSWKYCAFCLHLVFTLFPDCLLLLSCFSTLPEVFFNFSSSFILWVIVQHYVCILILSTSYKFLNSPSILLTVSFLVVYTLELHDPKFHCLYWLNLLISYP